MATHNDLKRELHRIDGRGYKAYKDIQGKWEFPDYTLFIDNAQGDPFAAPSKLRVRVPARVAQFDRRFFNTTIRRVALQDFLTRAFARAASCIARGNRGSGKSGIISIDRCGQEILERTAMVVTDNYVEARFVLGLPARGRRVLGNQAEIMLCRELPQIVDRALKARNLNLKELEEQCDVAEDAEFIRRKLPELNLIAFIANDSILPRQSGISDKPMSRREAVSFQSPPDLEVEIDTPNHGPIRGMGIPPGVTLIVGGGYHGKSTVLQALERGVYNHIPGDGREFVITHPDAVKIRAEDGRRVEKVNISPFINNLPYGKDTRSFSTDDASGSTSQAANIIEALEVGARVLLVDEDTSATNFMIRDARMQELVAKEKEPITPFIDKVRQLYDDCGVSTIIVVGGAGDYFDVSDMVLMMDEYHIRHVTEKAKEVARKYPTKRVLEGGSGFGGISPRIPLASSLDPTKGRKNKVKIGGRGLDAIQFGTHNIDLQYVEQIVDSSQTNAIGDLLFYAKKKYMDGNRTLQEIIELVLRDIEQQGLDILSPFTGQHPGDYAMPRRFEIAAAINRLRTLRIK